MSEDGLLRAAIGSIYYQDADPEDFDDADLNTMPDTLVFTSRYGLKAQSTSKALKAVDPHGKLKAIQP